MDLNLFFSKKVEYDIWGCFVQIIPLAPEA